MPFFSWHRAKNPENLVCRGFAKTPTLFPANPGALDARLDGWPSSHFLKWMPIFPACQC
jgi:hypothetical protein